MADTDPERQLVAHYDYADAEDTFLFRAEKYIDEDGERSFSQCRPDGEGGWIHNLKGVERVLYRLPQLLAADPDETVYVCEGEKDVDRLRGEGFVATTNPMGAGKWKDEYGEWLKGRDVVILPDNDKPGRDHAKSVATSLCRIARSVKIADLGHTVKKADVSDWLDEGHTADELRQVAASTKEWLPFAPFKPMSLTELYALELPEREDVVADLIPLGDIGLLSAREKSGKGLFSIDLCYSVANEEPFLGREVKGGPTVYIAAEERIDEVRARVQKRAGNDANAPFHILQVNGFTDQEFMLGDPSSIDKLLHMIDEYKPILVVIDVLREVHQGAEDKSDEMAPLLRPLRDIAHHTNTAIIVTHHHNKGGNYRGSTAIMGAFDYGLSFRTPDTETNDLSGTLDIKGRRTPKASLGIRFINETARWEEVAQTISVADSTVRSSIIDAVANGERLTYHELADRTGKSPKTIQNELSKMVKESPPPVVALPGPSPRQYASTNPRLIVDDAKTPSLPTPIGSDGRESLGVAGDGEWRLFGEDNDVAVVA